MPYFVRYCHPIFSNAITGPIVDRSFDKHIRFIRKR